jgi:excisionase family DNA binding protein
MNQNIILQGITVDDLLSKIETLLEMKLNEEISMRMNKEQKKYYYMQRKDVSKFLHISLPTLNEWTKQGLIPSYRIGNRVLYKSDEVEQAVNVRKFVRFK